MSERRPVPRYLWVEWLATFRGTLLESLAARLIMRECGRLSQWLDAQPQHDAHISALHAHLYADRSRQQAVALAQLAQNMPHPQAWQNALAQQAFGHGLGMNSDCLHASVFGRQYMGLGGVLYMSDSTSVGRY